jgi:hypothetical protein
MRMEIEMGIAVAKSRDQEPLSTTYLRKSKVSTTESLYLTRGSSFSEGRSKKKKNLKSPSFKETSKKKLKLLACGFPLTKPTPPTSGMEGRPSTLQYIHHPSFFASFLGSTPLPTTRTFEFANPR